METTEENKYSTGMNRGKTERMKGRLKRKNERKIEKT